MPAPVVEPQRPALAPQHTPIHSLLGIVEGEILEYLETHNPASLYRLIQAHDWPASFVIMAVGALVRQGLVRGSEQRLERVAESGAVGGDDRAWQL